MLDSAVATNSQPALQTNDYHLLPVTEKQISFARQIAQRLGIVLPWKVQQDRHSLSQWIDSNQSKQRQTQFDAYPSSKQVGFAERIARYKRCEVPHECFKDKTLMSRWIDCNK